MKKHKTLFLSILIAISAVSWQTAAAQDSYRDAAHTADGQRIVGNVATHNAHARGYRGNVEFVPLFSTRSIERGVGFSTMHGYQFNSHNFIGAGIMFLGYKESPYEKGHVAHRDNPLLASCSYTAFVFNYKCYFVNKRTTPYVDFQIGGSDNGGILVAGSMGTSYSLGRKLALNAALGGMVNNSGFERADCGEYEEVIPCVFLSSFMLKVGLEF